MTNIEGFFPDIDVQAYFGDPCPEPSLTQSIAKVLLEQSPRHAFLAHPRLSPTWTPGETEGYEKNRIIGDVAHAYALGRGKKVVEIPFTNFRTKDAQEARDKAFENGQVPVLPHHLETAREMHEEMIRQLDPDLIALWLGGDSEIMIAAQIEGTHCRSLLDKLAADRRTVFDYKTGGVSCAPHVVGKKLADQGADIQAAMHELILDKIDPENAGRRRHIFICQENDPPYAMTTCQLSETWLTMGRKKLTAARAIWAQCMGSNNWPAYPAGIILPEFPGYKERAWLDREDGGEFETGDADGLAADSLMGG